MINPHADPGSDPADEWTHRIRQTVSRRNTIRGVLAEVWRERDRQDEQWGEQNHPNGTGGAGHRAKAVDARLRCQLAAELGLVSFRDILGEEVAEAFAESDPKALRAELIQVAAVAVAWVEKLDREVQ
ncbi:hypothetical protein ACFYVR_15865 [Rhodococcus sp. NPDC003318]|uniref:hypothetical protein n=1 Tax=Rhodococcus sp. NPDC003318 TaxID=3364503 RepID=UPI00368BE707